MSGRRFFDVTVMRLIAASVLLLLPLGAQPNSQLSVTGDADVQVVLDRVRLSVGVESRDKLLPQARAHDDAAVKSVLAALRGMGIASGDIQTDFIRVDMRYVGGDGAAVDYYTVEKTIAVTLREVSRFEDVLNGTLDAGANHVCDVEFMTSELRKYRDQARAMAAKAALEKAVTWQQPPVCVWTRSRQASLPTHMEAGHGTVAFVTVASKHRTCIRTCIREAVRVPQRNCRAGQDQRNGERDDVIPPGIADCPKNASCLAATPSSANRIAPKP